MVSTCCANLDIVVHVRLIACSYVATDRSWPSRSHIGEVIKLRVWCTTASYSIAHKIAGQKRTFVQIASTICTTLIDIYALLSARVELNHHS